MNKHLQLFISIMVMISFAFTGSYEAMSQCTPADSTECPDPENNGEICPDSIAIAISGELYSQVVTILPPMTVGDSIDLHHITLVDVGNLPPGITWVSNATNNEFMAGTYHCILLEGTPDSVGIYMLRIVVDVYATVLTIPILIAQTIDSTSLSMEVAAPSGIPGGIERGLRLEQNKPNPFRTTTRFDFFLDEPGEVIFEVYTLLGEKIHTEHKDASAGGNTLDFNGQALQKGAYFYVFRSAGNKASGIMLKSD